MNQIVSGLNTAASDFLQLKKTSSSSRTTVLSLPSSLTARDSAEVPEELQINFERPVEKQEEHASDVNVQPTQEELHDISAAGNRLWELDFNRLKPGQDYEIDCGNGKKVYEDGKMAENRLFSRVNEDELRRPTYACFRALLKSYTTDQRGTKHFSVRKHLTKKYKREQRAFIEEISQSAPIKYLHEYLVAKNMVSKNLEEFKKQLQTLWFQGGRASSSAFKRVFVGEIKSGLASKKEVLGFHNWIQVYEEEEAGRLHYQGYIRPRRIHHPKPDSSTRCLMIQFIWNNALKLVSGTFVGVSPEFELALYTLCFYGGQEDNYVELGSNTVNIKCYHLPNKKSKMVSCYPVMQ